MGKYWPHPFFHILLTKLYAFWNKRNNHPFFYYLEGIKVLPKPRLWTPMKTNNSRKQPSLPLIVFSTDFVLYAEELFCCKTTLPCLVTYSVRFSIGKWFDYIICRRQRFVLTISYIHTQLVITTPESGLLI